MNQSGDKIAVVGTFDGVHLGHIYLLNALKDRATRSGLSPLIITFSGHPLETIRPDKVPPLLSSLPEKITSLKDLGFDNIAVLNFNSDLRNMSAQEFMTMLRDNYAVTELLLGYDTRFGYDRPDGLEAYQTIGKELGITVNQALEYIVDNQPVCSSRIRKLLATGEVLSANNLLGKAYTITGKVVHGKELGRKIGFPTANILPVDTKQLIPLPGVYAADIILPDNERFRAMINIGFRPTVDTSITPSLTLEAHLLGFEGDLYDHIVKVEFIDRIRDEKKFGNLDQLKTQLALDAQTAKNVKAGF
ncbi:MAG: bifunctional riboflavin kinase/FAD synthetase [Paramuribaculum sp.]|nr:bifunctional riboflavin kinase/FAD synthetase [Paramuribaculum sp.]